MQYHVIENLHVTYDICNNLKSRSYQQEVTELRELPNTFIPPLDSHIQAYNTTDRICVYQNGRRRWMEYHRVRRGTYEPQAISAAANNN